MANKPYIIQTLRSHFAMTIWWEQSATPSCRLECSNILGQEKIAFNEFQRNFLMSLIPKTPRVSVYGNFVFQLKYM